MNTDEQTASRSVLLEGEFMEKILTAAFKVLKALSAWFLEKASLGWALNIRVHLGASVVPNSQVNC
jgi:hypothetical protein